MTTTTDDACPCCAQTWWTRPHIAPSGTAHVEHYCPDTGLVDAP
jgi:hypothetical protein